MRIHILGMNGPYPAPGGACSGYLVEHEDTRVLLDCGGGALSRLVGLMPAASLDAAVLSHLHYDHMSDMLPLTYALAFSGREAPLMVVSPDRPSEVRALLNNPAFAWRAPEDFSVGALRFRFQPALHPAPAVSVSVSGGGRRLVYTGDTNLHGALLPFLQSADLLLMDAGRLARDWTPDCPHLSARLCGELAAEAKAKALLLTHLDPRYDPDDVLAEARGAFPEARLARVGESYAV